MVRIEKTLTANDVGLTGGHQSGIVIPKEPSLLEFFPFLDPEEFNPRIAVRVVERDSGEPWEFTYIYYNGKLHRKSTRNEYRLTGMTAFLRGIGADVGDRLVFERHGERYPISVWLYRTDRSDDHVQGEGLIRVSGKWKVISTR